MSIQTGNLEKLNKENPNRGGWFIGKFVPESSLLSSDVCEAKWARYKKGFKKDSGLVLDVDSRTVVILIYGKWRLTFIKESKEVVLSEPGDFVAFGAEPHNSDALEDSHVITVRWYIKS